MLINIIFIHFTYFNYLIINSNYIMQNIKIKYALKIINLKLIKVILQVLIV